MCRELEVGLSFRKGIFQGYFTSFHFCSMINSIMFDPEKGQGSL